MSFFKRVLDIIVVKVKEGVFDLPSHLGMNNEYLPFQSIEETFEYLGELGIEIEIFEPETRDGRVCYRAESGAMLYFVDSNLEQIVMMEY